MTIPTFQYEQALWQQGVEYVVGVDEVGRGALAGPVVAGAVVFDAHHQLISGVRDSKTLNKTQKTALNEQILANSTSFGIGQASAQEIDSLGIVTATGLAMFRAIEKLKSTNHLLIDGRPFAHHNLDQYNKTFIVKGDSLSYSIASASIIAKVYRDEVIAKMDTIYQGYNFAQHAGYGTTSHRKAISKSGVSPIHRLSFCKNMQLF